MVRYGVLLALIAVTYSYAGEDPTAPLGWVSPAKPELQKPSYPRCRLCKALFVQKDEAAMRSLNKES